MAVKDIFLIAFCFLTATYETDVPVAVVVAEPCSVQKLIRR